MKISLALRNPSVRISAGLLCICISQPLYAAQPSAPRGEKPLYLTISATSSAIKQGSNFVVHVSMLNTSKKSLFVAEEMYLPFLYYQIQIGTSDTGVARKFEYTEAYRRHHNMRFYGGSAYIGEIKSGDTFQHDVTLSATEEMGQSGKYSMVFSMDVSLGDPGDLQKTKSPFHVTSNQITVTIEPASASAKAP